MGGYQWFGGGWWARFECRGCGAGFQAQSWGVELWRGWYCVAALHLHCAPLSVVHCEPEHFSSVNRPRQTELQVKCSPWGRVCVNKNCTVRPLFSQLTQVKCPGLHCKCSDARCTYSVHAQRTYTVDAPVDAPLDQPNEWCTIPLWLVASCLVEK